LKNKSITRLNSERRSVKFLNRCEDSDNVAGRQHLLMYACLEIH